MSNNKSNKNNSNASVQYGDVAKALKKPQNNTTANNTTNNAQNNNKKAALPDTPVIAKNQLDTYVIGQDMAKIILSTSVYNHVLKKTFYEKNDGTNCQYNIEKSNILMVGPTGCGKTHLIKSIEKIWNKSIPFVIADATSLTATGYHGNDVIDILSNLYDASGRNIPKAQWGIVYIDEIDKLAKPANGEVSDSITVNVQQELLKMMEGATYTVPVGGKNSNGNSNSTVTMDTSNILFICGGAFPAMKEIISNRTHLYDVPNIFLNVKTEDLVDFGLIPEFIGRCPVICPLEDMSTEMLVNILTKPKNDIIGQYKRLVKIYGCGLEFTDDALEAIAELAIEKKTGARALRTILEEVLQPILYILPSKAPNKRVIIDRSVVLEGAEPQIMGM